MFHRENKSTKTRTTRLFPGALNCSKWWGQC